MNEEEFKNWISQISNFMKSQEETDEFIEYVCGWMRGQLKKSNEKRLIKEYHSLFSDKSYDEIIDFMATARFVDSELGGGRTKQFIPYLFNSAFFLYLPLLKRKYLKEGYTEF